jgi:hypothetical protein
MKDMKQRIASRRPVILFVGGTLALILMVWVPTISASADRVTSISARQPTATSTQTPLAPLDVSATVLGEDKLREDTKQVERQNDRSVAAWLWSNAATVLSTVLSAAAIAVAGYLGFRRWVRERKDAQNKILADRKDEREKRSEERFQSAIQGLGGEKIEGKIAAAVVLRTFLRPGYEEFYNQVFDLAVTNLRLQKHVDSGISKSPNLVGQALSALLSVSKTQPQKSGESNVSEFPDPLGQALITLFREAFPRARDRLMEKSPPFDPQSLDAAGIQLDRAHLYGADLTSAWMPGASLQKADLKAAQLSPIQLEGANLTGAALNNAILRGANLTRANLSEANLTGAMLPKATLEGAKLGGAVLTHVDLTGADLSRADLTDADLTGANPEGAGNLAKTIMHNVIGLSPEQCKTCKDKGADIVCPVDTLASNTS